jgi:hypothetical protein
MAIRLTETRLRQIIREEASKLTHSRMGLNEAEGSKIPKDNAEIAQLMFKDEKFFERMADIFGSTDDLDEMKVYFNRWMMAKYGKTTDRPRREAIIRELKKIFRSWDRRDDFVGDDPRDHGPEAGY